MLWAKLLFTFYNDIIKVKFPLIILLWNLCKQLLYCQFEYLLLLLEGHTRKLEPIWHSILALNTSVEIISMILRYRWIFNEYKLVYFHIGYHWSYIIYIGVFVTLTHFTRHNRLFCAIFLFVIACPKVFFGRFGFIVSAEDSLLWRLSQPFTY